MTELLLCALLLIVPASSQKSDLDPLVKGIQAKYSGLRSMSADFVQIYLAPGSRARRETGHLILKKPGKMRWEYASPEAKLYLSDGKVVVEYVEGERFATRFGVRELDDWRAPFQFLLGRGSLRRDFSRIEFASEGPTCATCRVLRMVPKAIPDFREILVEVEDGTLKLVRLTFLKTDRTRIDFLFSGVRENIEISDSLFTFKAPAGVSMRGQE